jgi:NADH-quinone oxidoreductase subunit N
MPQIDYHAILPELVLAGTIFLVLIADLALSPERKWLTMPVAFVGVAASLVCTLTLIGTDRVTFGTYVIDNFAVLFKVFFLVVALAILMLSLRYFDDGRSYQGEYYFLLLSAFLGMLTMPSSRDLLMLFISLELVSAPGFLLSGLRKRDPRSNEAALKFFLISVLSTAVMLYGMSLIYGVTGSISVQGIAEKLATPAGDGPLTLAAILFVVTGFAFKVSAVPFQFWAPDTYEGSPVPVAAFLSVASKAAGFAGLLQLMFVAFVSKAEFWTPAFAVLSVSTMTIGNLIALQQRQVVRLFAYSSIAQSGYMLLPFALVGASAAINQKAFAAAVLYILVYAVTNLGAFGVILAVGREAPGLLISDFAGLFRRAPAMAGAMILFLVSLAGIPILAGFWAKVFIFAAAVDAKELWLAIVMVVNSVISVVYYMAIAKQMMFVDAPDAARLRIPRLIGATVGLAALAVVAVGVAPDLFAKFPPLSTLVP